MKTLVFLLCLVSCTVFAQNYHYALDETKDQEAPSAPTNLVASNIGTTSVTLNWDAATDNISVVNYAIYNNDVFIANVGNVLTYNVTGLEHSTLYAITVRAFDAADNESSNSNIETFTTLTPPDTENPTAPLNLVASNIGTTSVNLTWDAASDNIGVVSYAIYNNDVFVTNVGNVLSYTVNGLNHTTLYAITIRAFDAENNESSNSNIESFTTLTPADTVSPTAPLNLVVSNITETTIDLSWDAATDNVAVANYAIYNNDSFVTNTGNVTSFSLTGLNSSTQYNITVRALDIENNESANSNLQSFTTLTPADTESPTAPLNLAITNISETTALLTWSPATDNVAVVDYRIYNNSSVLVNSVGNVLTYTLTGLNPSTNYNITVTALDAENNESTTSNTGIFTTANPPDTESPNAPLNLVANNITETSVDLTWNAATDNVGIANYAIYNNDTFVTLTGNVNTFTLSGLNGNTNYNLTLRAIDTSNNESNDSNNVSFVTDAPDTEAPSAPLNLVVSNITSNAAELSWTAATDNIEVTDYAVYSNGNILVNSIGNVTSYTLTGLSSDTLYNITLRALDEANNESTDSNSVEFTTQSFNGSENTPQEIAYFDAFEVDPSQSANLQSLLNTHGAIRLKAGDYTNSGTITMTSNQRIYGWIKQNGTTLGGDINIVAGSTNIHIENINASNEIRFMPGAPITNCTIKSVYYSEIECIGCQMEDNEFVDLNRVKVNIDCASSGFFRNNTWIRVFAQSTDDHVRMIGNDVTPSYGNVEISRNLLNSGGNTSEYRNIDNHNLVGTDAEHWNNRSGTANSAWYFRDIGTLKFFNSFGWSSPAKGGEFDIEADKAILARRFIGSNNAPKIQAGTDLLYIHGNRDRPSLNGDAWGFFGHHNGRASDINGSDVSSAVTGSDAARLNNLIFDTKKTPFKRPNLPILPNPTGANWANDRVGQTDQSAFIQNLINTNGVAELDEGIYYISQPLRITKNRGIIGKGTGKTAIVGITDDFPLIIAQDNLNSEQTNVTYPLAYLTLQGGSQGLHINPINKANHRLQITSWVIKHVVFRNQNYGINFDKFYAVDNTLINNVNFIDCNTAWFQDPLLPHPTGSGEYNQNMYIDKTLFYECQFIGNREALHMDQNGARPNNLNAWVNCKFENNDLVMRLSSNNAMFMANCDFTNNNGTYLFNGASAMSFYSCNFKNNSVNALFNTIRIYAEGCNFDDNIDFFNGGGKTVYLWNSNVSSNFNLNSINQGFFINNEISNNTLLSKPMVEVVDGNALTILDGNVNPYPQLLVKQ
ncbi:MAG: fibronectin type III domain-containing protein [Jejuia sp.]